MASQSSSKTTPIFPPWHFSRWHAVDDRVRGGSSQSHLDPVVHDSGSIGSSDEKSSTSARFWGTLDIKTLGGAGFASQKYQFGPTPLSLPRAKYDGVALTILPLGSSVLNSISDSDSRAHTFTLVFKTTLSTRPPSKPKTPPSPDPASLSYEHSFRPSSSLSPSITSEHSSQNEAGAQQVIHLPFDDFTPTYRGREVKRDDPRYVPFDPSKIYELSLMCRSDFGKQEGEFEVVIGKIEGVKRGQLQSTSSAAEGNKARDGCWKGLWGWLGWRDEGNVRLEGNEKA